ncbi:MAG: 3-phosphoshikimate 1-carboxyvinyltransferase [Leptolinea sp.]
MSLTIHPRHPLSGTISLPGDKSLSHRAALFASLAAGTSRIDGFLISGVTSRLLDALTLLGIPWKQEGASLIVEGHGIGGFLTPSAVLNCGNSATTFRFLAGALASSGKPAVLDGSAGLRRRPMERIIEPLQLMGVDVEGTSGCAPLTLGTSNLPLRGGVFNLPVASAQVKTCLLLAGLAAREPVTIVEPGFSRDHSERMLESMGLTIRCEKVSTEGHTQYLTHMTPPAALCSLQPLKMSLPGDFSSAAFLIVAALITPGSEITIRDVGLNATRTGLLDVLLSMGASIQITAKPTRSGEPVGDLTIRHSILKGVDVSGEQVVRMIDEFPIFAVAAAYAEGTSSVRDANELRLKESDRITALCTELLQLGAQVEEAPDGFTIHGRGSLQGGTIDPHGDHRLAMSLAIAGLAAQQPVTIENSAIINESFPEFDEVLTKLGANLVSFSNKPVAEHMPA